MGKKPTEVERPKVFGCATMDEHRQLARISPEYRRRAREIEYETRRFIARYAREGLKTGVVRIPVVVHIVYNGAAQDFTLAQVQAQIDALNADFRRTNADAGNVPAAFAPVAADTRIEFALAVRDPNCNPTTGVTHIPTTRTGFSFNQREEVKSSATGGADPWPSADYLNIWVANLTGGLLGFASFPAALNTFPLLDGVVIATSAFGVIPAHAPFHLGRIATHEVGHWLNVLHIWGDDGNACSGDDQCADTPNQGGYNSGAPTGIKISCNNGPDGDMYMNYMDYVDNATMIMFTADQALRMHAALSVERIGILASHGLVPPDAPATADLWIQGATDDGGEEPYAGSALIYCSDDIWVRNAADGLTYQDHQNPIAEQLNNVYVRVRNRACPAAGAMNGTVRLYWAKASPSLSWPAPWDGSITNPLMGGEIGNGQLVSVAGGQQNIAVFPWTPPDPSDYASLFGTDQAHFCLLARIETEATAPFGMTFPETGNFVANVVNNNNIAWKNIAIVDVDGPLMKAAVAIGQFDRERRVARYAFEIPKELGPNLFDWGFLLVEMRGRALAPWHGRLRGEGFQQLEDGRLLIMKPNAWFEAPPLKHGQSGGLRLRFVPDDRPDLGARVLPLDLTERDARGELLGAQRFLLKTGLGATGCRDPRMDAFDGVDWVDPQDLRADCCGPR